MSERVKELLRLFAAAIAPPFVGAAFVYLQAVLFGEYGWTLFVLLPVVMGFASCVIFAPAGGKSFGLCTVVSLYYIFAIAFFLIIFAIEGLVCLVMAIPLAVPLNILGVALAYVLTNYVRSTRLGLSALSLMVVLLPFTFGFEVSTRSQPTLHRVVTTVEIDAPIEKVWKNVIEFPQIDAEPEGVLRLGFAYPINARIDGSGVGAVRYCNFNTGPFVEPITTWQEPNLLAFDVREQPVPMTETSPYNNLHTAHLEYIRSQKGQFRLYEKDGKTVVEGTTWYTHDIAPDVYWNLFSDEIIHQIHLRVLNHIKEVSER
jgi:hypothetical protein